MNDKERGIKLVRTLGDRLMTRVHAKGCRMGDHCPEACSCFDRRKYPLGIHTAMLWQVATELKRLVRYKDRMPYKNDIREMREQISHYRAALNYHKNNDTQIRKVRDILDDVSTVLHWVGRLRENSRNDHAYYLERAKQHFNMATRTPNLGGRK